MNSIGNENEFPGQKAQKVPSGTVVGALGGAKTAAQDGETPVRLEISWHVAPAQSVAILDLSGKTGGHGLPPLATTRRVATTVQPGPQGYKYYL
jgi:hypothetical protein